MAARLDLRSEQGLTLVELVVVMFMLGLVLAAATAIFVSSMQSQSRLTNQFKAQEMLHTAVDKMRKDVNLACSTTASAGTALDTITFSDPPCDGTNDVTWCTSGSGTDYTLYRYTAASTCSGGSIWATNLTGGTIFTYYGPNYNAGSYSLAMLHLDLIVNVTPASSGNGYRDLDDLAFRNGARQ